MSAREELDALARELAVWRANRSSRAEKMPLDFVRRAHALSRLLPKNQIEAKAKIYRYHFKLLKSCDATANINQSSRSEFTEVEVVHQDRVRIRIGDTVFVDYGVKSGEELSMLISQISRRLSGVEGHIND